MGILPEPSSSFPPVGGTCWCYCNAVQVHNNVVDWEKQFLEMTHLNLLQSSFIEDGQLFLLVMKTFLFEIQTSADVYQRFNSWNLRTFCSRRTDSFGLILDLLKSWIFIFLIVLRKGYCFTRKDILSSKDQKYFFLSKPIDFGYWKYWTK